MRITKAVLRRAKKMIADPERWCKFAGARDWSDNTVDIYSPTACKFCIAGAIAVSAKATDWGRIEDILHEQKLRHRRLASLVVINDNSSHARVMNTLDELIEKAPVR